MKKVEIISRDQKDKEKMVSSLAMAPSDRLLTMLKLMELSFYLRSGKEEVSSNSDTLNVIELKLVNGTKWKTKKSAGGFYPNLK